MKSVSSYFLKYFPISQRDRDWGLYVTTAGESRISPGTSYPPNHHPEKYAFDWRHGRVMDGFAMVYISNGRGRFESYPSISADVETGCVFLLFPGVWHRYMPSPETGWREHWIGFDGETARAWWKNKYLSSSQPIIKVRSEEVVFGIFTRVMQAIRTNVPALQQSLAGATADLAGLLYCALHSPKDDTRETSMIERTITRIQEEYAQELNVEGLARDIGVSYSWFRKVFVSYTGMSPYKYLLEYRLVCARRLLVESELSVKEIATQTGFKDEHYFSRIFRRRSNMSPSQWRHGSRPAVSRRNAARTFRENLP